MRRLSYLLVIGALTATAAGCHKSSGGKKQPLSDMGMPADFTFVNPTYDLACAGSSAKATLRPVTLLFVLDASSSMADTYGNPPVSKYASVQSGLNAFFSDPASAGLSAAMTVFPFQLNPLEQCDPDAYDPGAPNSTSIPITALPNPSPFAAIIAASTPSPNAGAMTPTGRAVSGMITYGGSLNPSNDERVAMVLVTDGVPDACMDSTNTVEAQLAKVSTTLPTYVIGVGDESGDLNELATGGGTVSPIPVTVGDPAQTKTDILNALEGIRGLVLSCDFPVPAPPSGQKINYQEVNVTFTPSTGATEDLLYDANCVGNVGWYYDNPTTPTKVILCPNVCNQVRADHGGAIDVVFGCGTFMQVT